MGSGNPVTRIEDMLGLPEKARMRQRLTKKEIVLQYEGASPVDARLLTRCIASATIVGVLRPESVGVPSFQDAQRRVDFIPVLDVDLVERTRPADRTRVAELLHRSMPRPSILAFHVPDSETLLSVALTRLSKVDGGQETSVIEASLLVRLDGIAPAVLNIHRLNQTDLWALYRDVVRTAASDGRPASAALTASDAIALRRRLAGLEAELEALGRDAKRERSQQRRIDLNIQGRQLRTEIAIVHGSLFSPKHDTATNSTTAHLANQGRN